MDNADRAQIEIERSLQRTLDARQGDQAAAEPTVVCVECGNEIEPGRVGLGYITCIACAQWLERLRNQRGF